LIVAAMVRVRGIRVSGVCFAVHNGTKSPRKRREIMSCLQKETLQISTR
jgi:hypothetical protein